MPSSFTGRLTGELAEFARCAGPRHPAHRFGRPRPPPGHAADRATRVPHDGGGVTMTSSGVAFAAKGTPVRGQHRLARRDERRRRGHLQLGRHLSARHAECRQHDEHRHRHRARPASMSAAAITDTQVMPAACRDGSPASSRASPDRPVRLEEHRSCTTLTRST
jgi:hypothetical protein